MLMNTIESKLSVILKLCFEKSVIFNLLIFAFFSIILTYISIKIPDTIFSYKQWIFKERKWEKGGEIYQKKLKIKHWKDSLPELGDFFKSVFPKKQIKEFSFKYLQIYLIESCKAELTHWCIIFSSWLFVFWCDFGTYTIVSLIAITTNLPYVAIQRYNRPRILRLLHFSEKHEGVPLLNMS